MTLKFRPKILTRQFWLENFDPKSFYPKTFDPENFNLKIFDPVSFLGPKEISRIAKKMEEIRKKDPLLDYYSKLISQRDMRHFYLDNHNAAFRDNLTDKSKLSTVSRKEVYSSKFKSRRVFQALKSKI